MMTTTRGALCFSRLQQKLGAVGVMVAIFSLAFGGRALAPEPANAGVGPYQALLSSDGSGRLFVNNGSEPAWQVCAPDLSSCDPFATSGDLAITNAPSNVVFRAEDGSIAPHWVSPVWSGVVTSIAPPSVRGVIQANELVTPVPGGWQGGWATDRDAMQLSVCTNADGSRCTTITDSSYVRSCPSGAAVLDPYFVGWYLRVADRRRAADEATLFGSANTPYASEVWMPGPLISTEVVGQIAPARHSRTEPCGAPSLVRASISKRGIGRVKCGLGCKVELRASHRHRVVRLKRQLRPFPFNPPANLPVPRLSLSSEALARLGPGKARVALYVNGKPAARRTIALR